MIYAVTLLCFTLLSPSVVQSSPDYEYQAHGNTRQSEGTITTHSLPGSSGKGQPGELLNLSRAGFSLSDINLTDGSMAFTEKDLNLPGKNSLPLTISRIYNSRYFSCEAKTNVFEYDRSWSAWMGKGWTFGLSGRAFKVYANGNDSLSKIVIELNGQRTEYKYKDKGYSSDVPGNFNRIYTGDNRIELQLDNGVKYIFNKIFMRQTLKNSSGVRAQVTGLYLTEIKGIDDGSIRIGYESFGSSSSNSYSGFNEDTFTEHITGNKLKEWLGDISSQENYYVPVRPKEITDTFERKINLQYGESHNLCSINKQEKITGITYKNCNSSTSKIYFRYDSNGNLTEAQENSLPKRRYSYRYYDPGFKKMYFFFMVHGRGENRYWLPHFPEECGDDKRILDIYSNLQGYLLERRILPLGSSVVYEYKDALTRSPIVRTHDDLHRDWLGQEKGNIYYSSFLYEHASFPVVIKKRVYESSNKYWTYEIDYPYGISSYARKKRLVKESYTPDYYDSNVKLWYFKSAKVRQSAVGIPAASTGFEDKEYYFHEGKLIREKHGIYETLTSWQADRNLRKRITVKKAGVIQNETIFNYYDSYDNPTSITIKKGSADYQLKEFWYNYDFLHYNMIRLPEKTAVKDLQSNKIKYSFKTFNSRVKPEKIYYGPDNDRKLLTSVQYDEFGRVIKKTSHDSELGDLVTDITYTGGSGSEPLVIKKTVKGKSSITECEPYTGRVKKKTGPNGHSTTYVLDNYGRVTSVKYPDSNSKTISYSSDLKSSSTTFAGRTVKKYLDSLGRLIYVDYPAGEEDTKKEYYFGQALYRLYKGQYSSKWIIKKELSYDRYLRKRISKSPNWGSTVYSYNDSENKVTITDPAGRSIEKISDQTGQLIRERYVPDNSTTIYNYDNFGNNIQTIDPRLIYHKNEFDEYGRLTSGYHTQHGGASNKKYTELTYFDNGKIKDTKLKNQQGSIEKQYQYIYDDQYRLKQLKEGDTVKEELVYDEDTGTNGQGRLTTAENKEDGVKTVYDYDNMGRVIKETTIIDQIKKSFDIETSYTSFDDYAAITFDDGKKIDYEYYDKTQRMKYIKYQGRNIAGYTYNSNGTVAKITLGNGMNISYTYTKDILITNMLVKSKANSTFYNQTYKYDQLGNIIETQYPNPATGAAMTRKYSYTTKDELAQVDVNGIDGYYKYQYDKNGNATVFSLADPKGPAVTNRNITVSKDQLKDQIYPDGRKLSFQYDIAGNQTVKTRYYIDGRAPQITEYSYNYQDQLKEVKVKGAVKVSSKYNHKRQRVYSDTQTTRFGGGTKYYYWDLSGRIIGEGHTRLGNHTVRYIYSGNEKIAMIRPDSKGNEQIYYFINNMQGSPIYIVDAEGTKISKVQMDEWGN
ncbi:MAG: RHS repeat protein, partial [Lentisphaerae bacterium]|nr:RHS repeat protein [Lentisphaerota bacterium]